MHVVFCCLRGLSRWDCLSPCGFSAQLAVRSAVAQEHARNTPHPYFQHQGLLSLVSDLMWSYVDAVSARTEFEIDCLICWMHPRGEIVLCWQSVIKEYIFIQQFTSAELHAVCVVTRSTCCP